VLPNPRGFVKFFQNFKLPTLSLLPPFFQNYYKHPFYFLSFYYLPRVTILFLLKKVVRINVFQNLNRKLSSPKKSSKRSEFTLLKRRRKKEEVKEDPNSMANGSFQ
jgi:hypothetical protein